MRDFPPLLDATLDELQEGLNCGMFTSVDLVEAYISRIAETNAELRAVIEINPDALSIAAELDTGRQVGAARSLPLYGIPVLIKDNIATKDKMNNTAGSYALLGAEVYEDSTIVSKLRKAGAIVLGKTNLSQWADFREGGASKVQGWSARGGQTIGAYFPGQSPSGSSSGSGVASSIGLAWASLGTDTGGSIIHPSHAHNLVGIRPTVGLTSRHLVIPVSEHQDTVGPMARTVKDAAALLYAISGRDVKDNYTLAIPFQKIPDYVSACKLSGLHGMRIGVSRNLFTLAEDPTSKPAIKNLDAALYIIRSSGADVIDDIYLPGVEYLKLNDYDGVAGADFLSDLPRDYLNHLKFNPNNITSVAKLRQFTQSNILEGYPEHNTDEWDSLLARGYNNTSPQFWGNYTSQRYYAGPLGILGALQNYSLDAIVAPVPSSFLLSAPLGLPVITVPMGRSPDDTPIVKRGNLTRTAPNQPFGLSFTGKAFSEESLLGMAYAFEQRTLVRKSITPFIQPKTELSDIVAAREMKAMRGYGGEDL